VSHGTHLNFSPNTTIEVVGLSQASVDDRLLGLLGPYYRHMIGTFNTYSWGPTHRSLTDTGGGYNLGGSGLPHHTPQLFRPTVSTFHLRVPPSLRLSIQQLSTELKGRSNPKSHEWEPPLDFYCNLSSKHSITNGKPPRDRINKDK
jgi:hypothetical protein